MNKTQEMPRKLDKTKSWLFHCSIHGSDTSI